MRNKPILLDTFCKAGGASMGYYLAGFEVVGVDIEPQPRYPFEFIQADAIEYIRDNGHKFDVIAASPPCQKFSAMTKRWKGLSDNHPDLVEPTRKALKSTGKPYIVENVVNAPLVNPITLCGTMFGLKTKGGAQLRRHRLFECSPVIWWPPSPCHHLAGNPIGVYGGGQNPNRKRIPNTIGVWGNPGGSITRDNIVQFGIEDRKDAMGIDWMTSSELNQAIPPAYTKWIGQQILEQISERNPPND